MNGIVLEIMPTVNLYRLGITEVIERTRTFTGWVAASAKVMLVSGSYVPAQSHSSKSDVSSFEIQGGDYIAGGQLITNKAVLTVANQLRLQGSDVLWSSLTSIPRYAIIYEDTNAALTDKTLFAYMDLGNITLPRLPIQWANSAVLILTAEDAPGLP